METNMRLLENRSFYKRQRLAFLFYEAGAKRTRVYTGLLINFCCNSIHWLKVGAFHILGTS